MPGINRGTIGTTVDAILTGLSRMSIYWPLSWRSLSAIILGVILARWTWILFAPHATYTSAIPERAAGQEAGKLFGIRTATETASVGVALPNVQLLGVFAASSGKPGFAVLKLDNNRQAGVAEGEEVAPGTKLIEVNADYVLLERAGVQQRVNMENKYAASTGIKGKLPANGAATTLTPQSTSAANELKNRLRNLHR